mgnify:CR=1 FL=1
MAIAQVANIGSTGVIISANILSGATESEEIPTGGMVVWGVLISGAWTTANLKFKQGYVSGTRKLVTDGVTASTDYTVQATQDQWSPVNPAKGIGATGFVSIVTTAAQSGGDTLYVLLRYI